MAYVETCACGLFRGERTFGHCPDATVPICTDRSGTANRADGATVTTPPEPKATEPSDAFPGASRVREELTKLGFVNVKNDAEAGYILGFARGRASRDAEVAGLRARVLECETLDSHLVDALAEVEALKAERDKLHAAIAWREKHPRLVHDAGKRWYAVGCSEFSPAKEEHDDTDAGRAAALVRLFERCTK